MRAGRSVDCAINVFISFYRLPSRRTEDYPDSQRPTIAIKSQQTENSTDFTCLDRVSPNHRLQMTLGCNSNLSHRATTRWRRLKDFAPCWTDLAIAKNALDETSQFTREVDPILNQLIRFCRQSQRCLKARVGSKPMEPAIGKH